MWAYLVLSVSCIMVSCAYLQILLSIFGVSLHWLFIGLLLMGLIFALAHKDTAIALVHTVPENENNSNG